VRCLDQTPCAIKVSGVEHAPRDAKAPRQAARARKTAGTLTGPIRETGETLRWTLQSNRKQSFDLKERPCTRK
jgi:hypothetical protein